MTDTLAPHQQRAVAEKSELDDKIAKLSAFIDEGGIFATLDDAEQVRLRFQLVAMRMYSDALGSRIAAFR